MLVVELPELLVLLTDELELPLSILFRHSIGMGCFAATRAVFSHAGRPIKSFRGLSFAIGHIRASGCAMPLWRR